MTHRFLVSNWAILLVLVTLTLCTALAVWALQPVEVSTSGQSQLQEDPAILAPPTVVFIGDSYTGGSDMGGRGEANWTELAARELGWRACSFGIGGSGWTRGTNDWTFGARVRWALSKNPKAIVFANAINDLKSREGVGPAADEALAAVRERDPNIPIIVVGPTQVDPGQSPSIDEMDDALSTVAAKHAAIYISPLMGEWFGGENRELLGSDNFHPTDEGHQHYAELFAMQWRAQTTELDLQDKSDYVWCGLPRWQNTYPDGSPAISTPSSTPTP
jgi:lysophospholipase L1-like esterase